MPHDSYFSPKSCLVTIFLAGINSAVFIATAAGADPAPLSLHPSSSAAAWLTYMFCHAEAIHFITNLAVIVVAGVWLEHAVGHTATLIAYLAGGLAGALLFITACRLLDVADASLTGASAAALALAAGALASVPGILVRIRRSRAAVAGITLIAVIVLWGLAGDNPGGALAHAGGVAAGLAVTLIAVRMRRTTSANTTPHSDLITKVRVSGYSSLSREERRRLAADNDIKSNDRNT